MKIHSKLCQRCGEKRPLTDFYPDNSHKLGVGTYCKSCSAALAGEAYQRRKRAAKITPESKVCGTCQEIKLSADYWRSPGSADGLMPECKSCRRDRVRAYRYGLPVGEYDAMLDRQNGSCACCQIPSDVPLVVDHRHSDGKVRGLLCSPCNTALGLMGEDPSRLLSAIDYLITTSQKAAAS